MSSQVHLHIFWHQHQPWYIDPAAKIGVLPWVRLHGIKDYYDMAELSRRFDGWKQTINLVPSLLDQLAMYADGSVTDSYFTLSRKPAAELTAEDREFVLKRFFDAHPPRMIHPYPRYDKLYHKRGQSIDNAMRQFTTQDFLDLQVWHNLAWIDPIWRDDPKLPLADLFKKQHGFTEEDKNHVLDLQLEILRKIIPLHRQMKHEGKLEITCSPYYHPILPLLIDNTIARTSNPHDPVPNPPFRHPEDARWHIREGLNRFETIMDFRPAGMWPSEGSVSDEACALMAEEGISFFATDEEILFRSIYKQKHTTPQRSDLFRLHRLATAKGELDCAFRDHGLSDLIGFLYQDMDAKQAANDFIHKLKQIGSGWNENNPPFVTVLLDGENCWEFYHRDGHDFLQYLIEGILNDPQIQPTTIPEYRAMFPSEPTLRSIFPGSWINHNFRIWIGHPEDNAAWHFLRQARETLIQKEHTLNDADKSAAWQALHICEGSDWFWWYGDENTSLHDMVFDSLFREHLAHIYQLLKIPVPEALKRPIKEKKVAYTGGGILFRKPRVTGKTEGYYEWVGCREISAASGGGAMHQAAAVNAKMRYGRKGTLFSFLIHFENDVILTEHTHITVQITKPIVKTIPVFPLTNGVEIAVNKNHVEGNIDLTHAGLEAHHEVWFFFQFDPEDKPSFSIPHGCELHLQEYSPANSSIYWFM
jgi:alpha-amylase/alpha-mannosidase (GH57 family)